MLNSLEIGVLSVGFLAQVAAAVGALGLLVKFLFVPVAEHAVMRHTALRLKTDRRRIWFCHYFSSGSFNPDLMSLRSCSILQDPLKQAVLVKHDSLKFG